jgi:mannose/fructose/N-acetylgalactosamine-specific phosphotransferase system component IIC
LDNHFSLNNNSNSKEISALGKILPQFQSSLGYSEIVNFLKAGGKMMTSLSIVGTFLNHVGYTMLLDIH